MNSPLISIIVPVYKAESTINRCIDSILSQSFADFELILVDDGSPDKSGVICDEYASNDSRVKVFHKENGGVSSARNKGIDLASGEYITFVDSDDILLPNALLSFSQASSQKNIDLIIGGFETIKYDYSKNQVILNQQIQRTNFCTSKPLDNNNFLKLYHENNMFSTWGKLYKLKIVRDNNILFDETMIVLEDYCFVLSYLYYCEHIFTISETVYRYFEYFDLFKRSSRDYADDISKAYNAQNNFLKYNGITDDSDYWIIFKTHIPNAISCIFSIEYSSKKEKQRKFKRINQVLKEPVFNRFLSEEKSHSRIEHYFYMRGNIYGIFLISKIRKFI